MLLLESLSDRIRSRSPERDLVRPLWLASYTMKSLKNLIQALVVIAALALVLIALGYCFALFFVGGAL